MCHPEEQRGEEQGEEQTHRVFVLEINAILVTVLLATSHAEQATNLERWLVGCLEGARALHHAFEARIGILVHKVILVGRLSH